MIGLVALKVIVGKTELYFFILTMITIVFIYIYIEGIKIKGLGKGLRI